MTFSRLYRSLLLFLSLSTFIFIGCEQLSSEGGNSDDSSTDASETTDASEDTEVVESIRNSGVPTGVKTTSTTVTIIEEPEEPAQTPEESSTPGATLNDETTDATPDSNAAANSATVGLVDEELNEEGLNLFSVEGSNVAGAFAFRSFRVILEVRGKRGLPPPPGTEVTFSSTKGLVEPALVLTDSNGMAETKVMIVPEGSDVPREDIFIKASVEDPSTGRSFETDRRLFLSGGLQTFRIQHLFNPSNDPDAVNINPDQFGRFMVEVADRFGNPLSDESTLRCEVVFVPAGSTEANTQAAVFVNDDSQQIDHYADDLAIESVQFRNFTTPGPGRTQFIFEVPSNEEDFFQSAQKENLKSFTCELTTKNVVESEISDSLQSVDDSAATGGLPSVTLNKSLFLELAGPEGPSDNEPVQGNLTVGISATSSYFHNAPLYGSAGYEVELILQLSDANGNPVKEGTAVQLQTTSGVVQEVVRTNEVGQATAILRSGLPVPNPLFTSVLGLRPGEVRVTASTTRSDGGVVSAERVFLWSGSLGNYCIETESDFTSAIVRVEDINGNPVSRGSSLNCNAVMVNRIQDEETGVITETPEEVATNIEFEYGSFVLRTDAEAQAAGLDSEPQLGRTAFRILLPTEQLQGEGDTAGTFEQISCTLSTENGSPGESFEYGIVVFRDGRGDHCF